MSSCQSTDTSAVLVIFLVFSLLKNPVIGKPLMLEFEGEEWSSFLSTDWEGTDLMEEYDIFNSL